MQSEPSGQPKSKPKRFLSWSVLNRDLCQLEFFRRVLEEATDKSNPVLERLKFLAVFSSNLDEFFMVRVSGLKEMLIIDDIGPMPGELTPVEQLEVIRNRVLPLIEEHSRCLSEEVIPELESLDERLWMCLGHGVIVLPETKRPASAGRSSVPW